MKNCYRVDRQKPHLLIRSQRNGVFLYAYTNNVHTKVVIGVQVTRSNSPDIGRNVS